MSDLDQAICEVAAHYHLAIDEVMELSYGRISKLRTYLMGPPPPNQSVKLNDLADLANMFKKKA